MITHSIKTFFRLQDILKFKLLKHERTCFFFIQDSKLNILKFWSVHQIKTSKLKTSGWALRNWVCHFLTIFLHFTDSSIIQENRHTDTPRSLQTFHLSWQKKLLCLIKHASTLYQWGNLVVRNSINYSCVFPAMTPDKRSARCQVNVHVAANNS